MSLCSSIDTLSMAFLDDELAPEERRELELHLIDCPSCKQHVEGERADLAMLRGALVAPPAPELLKARIARALDAEDVQETRAVRRRWSQWVLPGTAMLAAAAAIAVFVGVRPSGDSRIATESVKQQNRSLPLEVQGASTGPWLREHFAPVEVPQFQTGIQLIGARLLPNGIAGRDAAMLRYLVDVGVNRVTLTAVVMKDVGGEDLSGGKAFEIGNHVLRLHDANGMPAISYVDPVDHVGYVFASERMTAQELFDVVVSSDLIARAQEGR
jgi:anti-sigma factor RsiW